MKFDIAELTKERDLIAVSANVDAVTSGWRRSFDVPAGWVAVLQRRDDDPTIVQERQRCKPTDADQVLFVQLDNVACDCTRPALRSSDGHECVGRITARVRILPETNELTAFRHTLVGANDRLPRAAIQQYLDRPLGNVLVDLADRLPADQLLKPLDASLVDESVERRLAGACLSAGLTLSGPVLVQFESPTFVAHRRSEAQIARQKARLESRQRIQDSIDAARQEHMTQLVEFLEQLKATNVSNAGSPMVELLRSFDESHRAKMYASLSTLDATHPTRSIAVVAGDALLLINADNPEQSPQRVDIPNVLGGLRSVRMASRSELLIGAKIGVHALDANTRRVNRSFRATVENADAVRGGVNAAARHEHFVFAAHSELGLLRWSMDTNNGEAGKSIHAEITAGANAVRGVQVADGAVWFTVDAALWCIWLADDEHAPPTRYVGSDVTLSALTVVNGTVYAGNVNGEVIAWDVGEPESPRVLRGRTGEPVGSIDLIDTGGVERLVIADRGTALTAMVLGDTYVCRYESAGLVIRYGAAAEDILVAINDARDRLLIWRPDQPHAPATTLNIAVETGHRIQDVCLVPEPE